MSYCEYQLNNNTVTFPAGDKLWNVKQFSSSFRLSTGSRKKPKIHHAKCSRRVNGLSWLNATRTSLLRNAVDTKPADPMTLSTLNTLLLKPQGGQHTTPMTPGQNQAVAHSDSRFENKLRRCLH